MTKQILPVSAIEKKLKEFRLSGIADILEVRIKQATDEDLGYTEFLGLLLEDETNKRSENRRIKLYRGSHLPYEKVLWCHVNTQYFIN